MAKYFNEISRTFSEFLLIPGLTKKSHIPSSINLTTPLVKYRKGESTKLVLNIPLVSSVMQAVSGPDLGIALSRCGGMSFIFHSQPIESQVEMVRKVKSYKSGFVVSDSNLPETATLKTAVQLSKKTGHHTIAVTQDGKENGRLLGLLTSRDFRPGYTDLNQQISKCMTPSDKLVVGRNIQTLSEANEIIWKHKLNCLPILDEANNLKYLVFRKDYEEHKKYPTELVDGKKRLRVGAGINTHDYQRRVPALLEAGVDLLCIDSSDGYTEWQHDAIVNIKNEYGSQVYVGGGNVVDADGFRYLAEAGADFIKIGIGGGSICITREQKGIGRGQASALMDVCQARDHYFQETGWYIPLCSDGGILYDYHMALALAMGADFLMLGRYFARFDEAANKMVKVGNKHVKEYWGEGSQRAKNWQRYDLGGEQDLVFEEGVDGYVPYAGRLKDNLDITLYKIKATMCNCGVSNLDEFRRESRITMVSQQSFLENTYSIQLKEGMDEYKF